MLVTSDVTRALLEHRFGKTVDPIRLQSYETKALELNREGPSIQNTLGRREIRAYVGFIDLAGFSNTAHGKPPSEIRDFLKPFLQEVLNRVNSLGGLIDKTIGDEVMFAFLDPDGKEHPPAILRVSQFLGALMEIPSEYGNLYRFRLGLSHGMQIIDLLEGTGYQEWTLFGEPIHVAKRLMGLESLSSPDPIMGAIGISTSSTSRQELKLLLEYVAGFASRWTYDNIDEQEFQGVGPVTYSIVKPKSNLK